MAKRARVWTGTEFVDLASSNTDLSNYANLTTNQPTFRNFIINGGMDIAQRGTSITRGNVDGYTLDRWYASGYGSGQNFTISRSSATPPTGFQYFQRIATTTTSGTNLFISQSLETSNVVPMQGRTVTLSFRYRLPVNFTNAWTAQVYWSTATDANLTPATSKTSIASKTLTNTTSWTADSLTFVVPATATALSVEFITTGNVVNGAQFDFTGVQLELGSIATPFERRPIGTELALCQRYYYRVGGDTSSDLYFSGFQPANTYIVVTLLHPVPMRAIPSLAQRVGTWAVINTPTQPGPGGVGTKSYYIAFQVNAGISNANQSAVYTNSTGHYLEFGAEL